MPNTTNGLPYPNSTDPVANGATNIEDLADAVDARTGLWLVTTCTVSSVGGTAATVSNGVITIGTGNTSITISNAFSAMFNNYKILVSGGTASQSTNITLQMGSKTSGYRSGLLYHSWSSTPQSVGSTTAANMVYAGNASTTGLSVNLELVSPFLATNTFVSGQWSSTNDAGVSQMQTNDTTSYSAFTLSTAPATMTGGTIRVYGYRN